VLSIIGARGKIQNAEETIRAVQALAKKYDVDIQMLNANLICGEHHLISAATHAIRALARHENIGATFGTELLRYASCSRQVKDGVDKLGIKDNIESVAIVISHDKSENELSNIEQELLRSVGLTRDDNVLEPNIIKLERLGISKAEINTVPATKIYDLILEHIAIVDVMKK
jgi:tRNA threonylcarbamoyladenosine modification (KEOPS) complex Cgi121 subunit